MGILRVKNLRVHYNRIEAVRGVSMGVGKGEVVSLVGANGGGKTSILKTIFGLKPPSSGEVWFGRERIDGWSTRKIAESGIAFVFENRRLFPFMTVRENLEMGAYLRRGNKAISTDIKRMFDRFPLLTDRRKQKANTLSGGEQQMLAIGRALMGSPKLLLMDEPSLGLAPLVVRQIAGVIKEINHQGVSVLLVEQNTKLGLEISQKGYVLETGKIILEGNSRDLIRNEHVKKAYLGG